MIGTRKFAGVSAVLLVGMLASSVSADLSVVGWELNTFTASQGVSTPVPAVPLPFNQVDAVPSPLVAGQSNASSTYAFAGAGGTATFSFGFAHELNTANVGDVTGSDGYLSFVVDQDTAFALGGAYGFVGAQQEMVALQSWVELLLGDNASGTPIESFDPSTTVGFDGVLQAGQLYTVRYSYLVVPYNPSSIEVETYAGTAAGALNFATAVPAPGAVVLGVIGLGCLFYRNRAIRAGD